jgi:type III secretion protein V
VIRELIVPVAVLGVLASMLLPVPPAVMDFLLVGNLILALVLFLSTLYIPDTLRLSALPTMLLLATLYRLALNISTTRNILSAGDGGRVVEAFGGIVIQGNLVVGVVIFLIITLVQFIVIAKGSERVAEVSARFTLDALPGKQMSIDADVRAGVIDVSTARVKRQDLQTESRFYGALDGAMKFVKGDAIAGIIITVINIVGGLAIGIISEGLPLPLAVTKYTTLTIGDGLVAQIPALLNSLAAGIVVTRVARGDDASLAGELLSQLGQVKRAKLLCAALCFIFASVPEMPALPFLALGLVALGSSLAAVGPQLQPAVTQDNLFVPKPPALLRIEMAPVPTSNPHRQIELVRAIERIRDDIYQRHGVILPFPEVAIVDARGTDFQLVLRGVPVKVVADPGDQNSIPTLASAVRELFECHLLECLDDTITRKILDTYEAVTPELVASVVPGVITVTQLTEILKALIHDGISVRPFEVILQAVAEYAPKASNERVLLEEVRIALRRMVSHSVAQRFPAEIPGVVLHPIIDLQLSRHERERSPVDLNLIDHVVEYINANPGEWILLTSRSSRRLVREFLELKGVRKMVIAHEELVSEIPVMVKGEIAPQVGVDQEQILNRLAA